MKKYLALLAIASLAIVSCGEKPEPTPTPSDDEKAFSVTPETLSVGASDTSASIEVKGEVAWSTKSDNSNFVLTPASGNGNGTVTVSFPANTSTNVVTAKITIFTDDKAAKTKSFTIPFTQAAAEVEPTPDPGPDPEPTSRDTTYLARWWFDITQVDILNAHFAEEAKVEGNPNPDAGLPGNGGYYVEPNVSGKGRIEFYNGIDKNSINPKGRVKRVIGKYGGIVSYGTWKGDYYLLTAETDAALPAGTDIYTFFALRPNTDNVPRYWLVEILDGDTWKPYFETKKVTVSGEGEVEYNIELVYDNDAEKPCIDSIVDCEYKLTASTKNVVIRILAVSSAYYYGKVPPEGLPAEIGDSPVKVKNPVTILVGNRTAENGNPVLHHTMICTLTSK